MTLDDRSRAVHWQTIYTTKSDRDVSWFEDTPEISMALLRAAGLSARSAVADIGGGASRLVDCLVGEGIAHVTVLDLSAAAIDIVKARLGAPANVAWVSADVTRWRAERQFDLWHDRAAFHFLTDASDRQAYVKVLTSALKPGGRAVIGTFAPDGPEKCSGLPIVRYDAAGLSSVLGPGFSLVATQRHSHVTPWQSVQAFQFSTFERNAD